MSRDIAVSRGIPSQLTFKTANVSITSHEIPPPPAHPRVVNVSVYVSADTTQVNLGSLPLPLTFEQISGIMESKGYPKLDYFTRLEEERIILKVTSGSSTYDAVNLVGTINLNQPLLHYYNEVYDTSGETTRPYPGDSDPEVDEARISGSKIIVDDLTIQLHRTVRVPDNNKSHALPPSLANYDIFNVADYRHRLPSSMVAKGGAFISMYQREAMWMSFRSEKSYAVKVSVGGVNALTGTPQEVVSKTKQDYLAIKKANGQSWLDGISISPGVVRQFVAMPLGQGYTTEEQVTGKHDVGGIQIDVFPMYPKTASFERNGRRLKETNSPRRLGLKEGEYLAMTELIGKPKRLDIAPLYTGRPHVVVYAYTMPGQHDGMCGINVLKKSTRDITYLECPLSCPVETVKKMIYKKHGIPPYDQQLTCAGLSLEGGTLADHQIKAGYTILLSVMHLSGGSPSTEDIFLGSASSASVKPFGLAPGGRIGQKIIRDTLPFTSYDRNRATRLHISVLNTVDFMEITGLSAPSSPVSAQTYLKLGLPWFALYDEKLPRANNTDGGTPLSTVRSVADIGGQFECGHCDYGMATWRLRPCGHALCESCAEGLDPSICPAESCDIPVRRRERFAAPMPKPGKEENDGVEAETLDARIVKLGRCAERGVVGTFKLKSHGVSLPGGPEEDDLSPKGGTN